MEVDSVSMPASAVVIRMAYSLRDSCEAKRMMRSCLSFSVSTFGLMVQNLVVGKMAGAWTQVRPVAPCCVLVFSARQWNIKCRILPKNVFDGLERWLLMVKSTCWCSRDPKSVLINPVRRLTTVNNSSSRRSDASSLWGHLHSCAYSHRKGMHTHN